MEFIRFTEKQIREKQIASLLVKAADKLSPPPEDKYTVIGRLTGEIPGTITVEVMHFDCIDIEEEDG